MAHVGSERCPACERPNRPGALYCAHCGRALASPPATSGSGASSAPRRSRLVALAVGVCVVALAAGTAGVWLDTRAATDATAAELQGLRSQLAALTRSTADLAEDLRRLRQRVGLAEKRSEGTRALAAQVLPNVLTVEAPDGSGAGFVAWREGRKTMILTAGHVVSGWREVTVRRGERSWQGHVVGLDETNDLASIEVDARIGRPLWQDALAELPDVGTTLVLFGSPLGLEGTVTRGVVSRVAYNEIQTDAPATFGSSGGPAVTEDGALVGVVTSGVSGTDINFVVPIRRACVQLRACEP